MDSRFSGKGQSHTRYEMLIKIFLRSCVITTVVVISNSELINSIKFLGYATQPARVCNYTKSMRNIEEIKGIEPMSDLPNSGCSYLALPW